MIIIRMIMISIITLMILMIIVVLLSLLIIIVIMIMIIMIIIIVVVILTTKSITQPIISGPGRQRAGPQPLPARRGPHSHLQAVPLNNKNK